MARPKADLGALDQQVMMAIMRLHPRAYGVSIKDFLHNRAGLTYSVGAIYAALDRLEDNGYVTSKQGEPTPERGGRAKLYFTLTASGQMSLQQSLKAFASLRRGIRWQEVLA